MAGSITFGHQGWNSNWSGIYYVFDFLIKRLPDGPNKSWVKELDRESVPFLDLSDRGQSEIVDLIANELSAYVDAEEISRDKDADKAHFDVLVALAKAQQARNASARASDGGN